MPAMRGPWPTTRVSLNAAITPSCASVSGSPGRCTCQSLAPSAASKACTARSTPRTKIRPPATSGAVATRTPSAFFHLTWPASSAIRSPPRVTTAATLPSLPTPAESLAPTLARQTERPLAASRATTLPSLEARVTTPSLTAGTSGNSTLPMLSFQTWAAVIGATIGCSSLGCGPVGTERVPVRRVPARAPGQRRRDEQRRESPHLPLPAPLAALAAGSTPRTLSLASTTRR